MKAQVSDSYLMHSDAEPDRIESKTDIDATVALLRRAGLKRGHRALDVGCASGSTTRAMACLTAPHAVRGVDLDPNELEAARRFAAQAGYAVTHTEDSPGIRYVQGDATDLPFPDATFDLTWSRFLFEYLRNPTVALAEMMRITKPGGRVVVADLDGNCVFHYPLPTELAAAIDQVAGAALHGFGFDPFVGRKLYTWFVQAGMVDIKVHVEPYHVFPGPLPDKDRDNWWQKLDQLAKIAPRAFGSHEVWLAFRSRMESFLMAEETFTYSTLIMVSGSPAPLSDHD